MCIDTMQYTLKPSFPLKFYPKYSDSYSFISALNSSAEHTIFSYLSPKQVLKNGGVIIGLVTTNAFLSLTNTCLMLVFVLSERYFMLSEDMCLYLLLVMRWCL